MKLELNQTTDFTALGTSSIVFMFSANKGGSLAPLKKAASGGELARFIISVKNLIASKTALPTIIFDEIDTGVSGKIADKIGVKMVEMAQGFQVFAITHLPQIAGKGNQHLKVYKTEEADRTITHLTKLTDNERVEELAMMLSGDGTSEAALANAKELLG